MLVLVGGQVGMVTQDVSRPYMAYLPFTIRPRTLHVKYHPNQTWWLDPRRQSTYCQVSGGLIA